MCLGPEAASRIAFDNTSYRQLSRDLLRRTGCVYSSKISPLPNTLPASRREALIARVDQVRSTSQNFGYGVDDEMDFVFAKHTKLKD
jgi:hypothetical protein